MSPNFFRRPRPRRGEQRGLRLLPVGIVLPATFIGAIAVAYLTFHLGWELLGARELQHERRITSKTLFELVKLSFGVVAGAGALVALVVAYRRQKVDEDGARREEEAARRDVARLHNERFTNAVSQLDASPAVRLGGVHALAGLADDAPTRDLRQTCIDVLCAYLRLPYISEADLPGDDPEVRHEYLALRQVRHTVIRLISDHLRLDPEHPRSWQGHDLDFTGAHFDGGDFREVVFSGGAVDFTAATFSGGAVDFTAATFSGGTVDFSMATFSGGDLDFGGATFSDSTVHLSRATFSDSKVDFGGATFSGGTVYFSMATFSGGDLDFGGATFSGSTVHLSRATFSDCEIDFGGAVFSGGTVDFSGATFPGSEITFSMATFSDGTIFLNDTLYSGGRDNLPHTWPAPSAG